MSRAMLDANGFRQLAYDGTELHEEDGDPCCCFFYCCSANVEGDGSGCGDVSCDSFSLVITGGTTAGTYILTRLFFTTGDPADYGTWTWTDGTNFIVLSCGLLTGALWDLSADFTGSGGANLRWGADITGGQSPADATFTLFDDGGSGETPTVSLSCIP